MSEVHVCYASDMHPWDCDGKPTCGHCMNQHDPSTCCLCWDAQDPENEEPGPIATPEARRIYEETRKP